jgi:predicted nucleic acid-binding protein
VRVLFDTSTLIAAFIDSHPAHAPAAARWQKAKAKVDAGLIAMHSIAELYAILTTLPQARLPAAMVQRIILQDVLDSLEVVALTPDDYRAVINQLAESEIIGGTTYDALILRAAEKANADQILTLNTRHFHRVRPDLADKISVP